MAEIRLSVEAPAVGLRLDLYIVRAVGDDSTRADLSRSEIQRLVSEGRVTVNDRGAKPNTRLKLGDIVRVHFAPPADSATPPEDLPLDILFEDEQLIVVNKAAGMIVHPTPNHPHGTLVNALLHHCPDLTGIGGERRPGIVHRLDKETSGVMVAAKTAFAFSRLAQQFKAREIEKEYLALVWGLPPRQSGIIDRPIGRHRADRKRMSSRFAQARRRESVTLWVVEKTYRAGGREAPAVSLLRVTPKTGRTHQIRVHLTDFGYPIVGDKIYSHRKPAAGMQALAGSPLLAFSRQALHAERLAFDHPASGDRVEFHAPLPGDMKNLLAWLEGASERETVP